jgi:hypothetical protein
VQFTHALQLELQSTGAPEELVSAFVSVLVLSELLDDVSVLEPVLVLVESLPWLDPCGSSKQATATSSEHSAILRIGAE